MRFSGKTALVTGAASGIGRAAALALAAEGAVRGNDIAPGFTDTPMVRAIPDKFCVPSSSSVFCWNGSLYQGKLRERCCSSRVRKQAILRARFSSSMEE